MADADVLERAMLAFATLGVIFSLYAMGEVLDATLAQYCSPPVLPWLSCTQVLTSGHTTVFGVQDWSIGLAGFVVLLALTVLLMRSSDPRFLQMILLLSGVGLIFAAYFVSVEASLHAVCIICTGAHLSGLAVFLVALKLTMVRTKALRDEKEELREERAKSRKPGQSSESEPETSPLAEEKESEPHSENVVDA
ncbi:MAG: hypothetical protein KGJ23_07150 [Euryarchaeota archaeon]|nr:hypothetical protein [Euryarchaeota archaeon]MDE2044228.1 hypothetical protein [Thermoplasmata archaeon]